MNHDKKNKLFVNLWLSPLLVGSFFAIGYNLTRNFQVFNTREPKVFLDSFETELIFPGKNMTSFKQELNNQNDSQLIKEPTSTMALESFQETDKTQIINLDNAIDKNEHSENQKSSKVSEVTSNHSLDSIPIETQLFFKKHNIDEVIKKLPMP